MEEYSVAQIIFVFVSIIVIYYFGYTKGVMNTMKVTEYEEYIPPVRYIRVEDNPNSNFKFVYEVTEEMTAEDLGTGIYLGSFETQEQLISILGAIDSSCDWMILNAERDVVI